MSVEVSKLGKMSEPYFHSHSQILNQDPTFKNNNPESPSQILGFERNPKSHILSQIPYTVVYA